MALTFALGVFTFAFLPEIKADSAAIALLDNGILHHKDLKHGVFEIDHFADVQSIQELQSLLTNDGHGDAVIDLGLDSLTLQGVTTQQLQQVIQQGHVFLH